MSAFVSCCCVVVVVCLVESESKSVSSSRDKNLWGARGRGRGVSSKLLCMIGETELPEVC